MALQACRILRTLLILLVFLTGAVSIPTLPGATAQPGPGQTVVLVWSNLCGSSNITITNLSCGDLSVGNLISVEINVTNAPSFNAYDFTLDYDPDFLTATSTQVEGAGVVFNNTLTADERLDPGRVRLAVTALGEQYTRSNGTIAKIFFRILAVGVSPLALAAGMKINPGGPAQTYTLLTLGGTPIDTTTEPGYFKNDPVRVGPVASFTFSPSDPEQDEVVSFNATGSFDPDDMTGGGGIFEYIWDFGDGGGGPTGSPITTHTFRGAGTGPGFLGNFSVRLAVVDINDGFQGMAVQRIFVVAPPLHDLAVTGLLASPGTVSPGELVTISITVRNQGTFDETFDLSVTYGPPTVSLGENLSIAISASTNSATRFILDTTGLAPSAYTVTVTVLMIGSVDANPANNISTTVVNVVEPGESQLLLIVVGAVVAAAVIVTVGLLLKRRREKSETE